MSTVKILRSLNDGYKIDVRGKTELKVLWFHWSTEQLNVLTFFLQIIVRFLFIYLFFYRVKVLKKLTG